MAQLAHRARFDLTNALAGEVESFADFFEGARLTAIETEAQSQDLSLTRVERGKQSIDFFGQEGGGCNFERRLD